jgi:hypothetical protein
MTRVIPLTLLIPLALGCAMRHERPPQDRPAAPVSAWSPPPGAGASDAGLGPQAPTWRDAGPICAPGWDPACAPTEQGPVIGGDPYCPADHEWVPALAAEWGVERHVAERRCRTWVLCPGPVECYHCAEAGRAFMVWDGSWCR